MFKNHESPISLFSFQDIITCLTGIMLFFLLILALKIMEIAKVIEEQSPHRDEIAELRRQNELLRRQLGEISRDIRGYRERIRKAGREDRPTLSIAKFRLERRLREIRRQLAEAEKIKSLREDELRREEERRKRLEERERRLRAAAEELDRLVSANRSCAENIKKLRDEIAKRRRTIHITVSGRTSKRPVAVECSRDRIRLVDLQKKSVVSVERTSPFLSDMVNAAAERLRDYPADEYYFALLIKPSAAPYAEYLTGAVRGKCPGVELGSEPILESEVCD